MMNKPRNYNIYLIIICIFALGLPFLFKKTGDNVTTAKTTQKFRIKQINVINGYVWNDINSINMPLADKNNFKANIVKIVIETSLVYYSEIISSPNSAQRYFLLLNKFYENPENLDIPVYFALGIIRMEDKNYPQSIIDNHKSTLREKLLKTGMKN